MKKYNLLRFKYVSQLNLLDLKAQKKNIHYKRFLDLPLTLQESIASKTFTATTNELSHVEPDKNMKFRITRKKLENLSRPKRGQQALNRSESLGGVSSIITKCDRLRRGVVTDKKLVKFQRDAGKCYDYLFQLSNYNFQKYEQQ